MGYNLIKQIHRLEEQAHSLGFMLSYPKYGWSDERGDLVALRPRDDELPIYSRDAELFTGTITEAEKFLRGIEWAREYDHMLKLSTKEKRVRKEQDERNRKLVRVIKNEIENLIGC